MLDKALHLLHTYYGYHDFKEGQRPIISSILAGKNTLGIMPTGGGKSICYQIPALLFGGLSLVISPLISLMKDQVDALKNIGIPATFINSSLTPQEVHERIHRIEKGEIKLLYVAPERFDSEDFIRLIQRLDLSLVAIDEVHCMSQWGHDFRPSYRSIGQWLARLPQKPIMTAFTATATKEVVQDICQLLSLEKDNVYITGFKRKNLHFSVIRGADKDDYIPQYLKANYGQSGIIYAGTRKKVDQIYQRLRNQGYEAAKYHAGLTEAERQSHQERFLYDEAEVMVATNAFGMGIDKSNVRFVLHYNMPKSMEYYYQEAGRAGRDGEPSRCILLFNPMDINLQKYLIEQSVSPNRQLHEYQKLQVMIDYCHTQQCLQDYIVRYFGEESAETCGRCNNCQDDFEEVDVTTDTQKILSCIRRMHERFGVALVAKVLSGAKDKRVRELRLDRLPTYGAMHTSSQKEITNLINLLIAEKYLILTAGQYPVVQLSQPAVPVLKGQQRVYRKVKKQPASLTEENELFERLRQLRKKIAQQEQVPPYVIFADSTLRELSQFCPTTRFAMLRIKGVGEVKFEKYGETFIQVIRDYISTKDRLTHEG